MNGIVSKLPRKHFLSEQQVLEDSFRLGVKIFNSGFRPSFIVGLWRGGSTIGIYVQECLQTLGVQTDHIAIRTSYEGPSEYQAMLQNPERNIRVHGTKYLLDTLNHDDALLLVDDVYSSGRNVDAVIELLKHRLKRNMPADVRVAVLWAKPEKRQVRRLPDYHLHETNNWLVLPYELKDLSVEELEQHKQGAFKLLKSIEPR